MKKFLIIILFTIFAASITIFAQAKDCGCRNALNNDIPLGGNEIITENVGTVKQVRGVTRFLVSGKNFEDVVVEVFNISKNEEKNLVNDAWKIVENKKRKVACITGKSGKFCFKTLPKGAYVLRVGTRTRKVEYFNYVHVIVKVNPKSKQNKKIKVDLKLAT
jgi:hypothetical protein